MSYNKSAFKKQKENKKNFQKEDSEKTRSVKKAYSRKNIKLDY